MSAVNEPRRNRGAEPQSHQQFSARSKSCSIASLATSVSVVISAASGGDDDWHWQYTSTAVQRVTPILFSSNRGLHLRVARRAALTATEDDGKMMCPSQRRHTLLSASAYEINFCDLERWSTNRANTVSLCDPQLIAEKPNDDFANKEKAYDSSFSTSTRIFTVARGSLQYSNPATKRAQAHVHFNKLCSRHDQQQNTTTESAMMMFH